MWNLKYGTNEPIYKTETDSDVGNRRVVAKGKGAGEGEGWSGSLGMVDTTILNVIKLLHLEWINNKVLMYNTGNCTQYSVMNHNGKEYKKRMYVWV